MRIFDPEWASGFPVCAGTATIAGLSPENVMQIPELGKLVWLFGPVRAGVMIELNLQNKTAAFPRRFLIQSDTLHYYKFTKVRGFRAR